MVSTWMIKAELRKYCLARQCKECMFCYDTNNCDFENMNDEILNKYYSIMKERLSNDSICKTV